MLPFDNLVNLAQSFLQQATPDPTQWNDAAAHTFAGELHSINAELQALQRIVLAIDVAEIIVGV
jgi:hypothetical protein